MIAFCVSITLQALSNNETINKLKQAHKNVRTSLDTFIVTNTQSTEIEKARDAYRAARQSDPENDVEKGSVTGLTPTVGVPTIVSSVVGGLVGLASLISFVAGARKTIAPGALGIFAQVVSSTGNLYAARRLEQEVSIINRLIGDEGDEAMQRIFKP